MNAHSIEGPFCILSNPFNVMFHEQFDPWNCNS